MTTIDGEFGLGLRWYGDPAPALKVIRNIYCSAFAADSTRRAPVRNRDMPANTTGLVNNTNERLSHAVGLTKLEFAAIAAMKGMLASGKTEGIAKAVRGVSEEKCTAYYSVAFANALFDELDSDGGDDLAEDAVVGVNVGYGDVIACTVCGGPPGSCARNIDDCPHR